MNSVEVRVVTNYKRDIYGWREASGHEWQIWWRKRLYAKSPREYGSRHSAKAAGERFIEVIRKQDEQ